MALRKLTPITEEEAKKLSRFNRALKDRVGPPGSDGKSGKDGRDGIDGLTIVGPEGAPGRPGADGKDGVDGKDGRDGLPGVQGEQGEKGDKPDHRWEGTKLAFEKPDGSMGRFVDLRGRDGQGGGAVGGSIPLRYKNVSMTYDADGLLETITQHNMTWTITRDGSNRILSVSNGKSTRLIARNANGSPVSITVT